ncbi:FG-GAP repeat domain-containing protein [Haliangium sp.]|uniref:FG-GAP repeat domain-containing protein n=1 Tax=Haliangium sp. TaxID=2663208 RepID=UPI003D14C715
MLAATVVAGAGCTEIPSLRDDVCGNRVVEAGEDCDGDALGGGSECGAPDTATGCFLVCEGAAVCPQGWGCGRDGRCRRPSTRFSAAAGSPLSFSVDDFAIGDVDGDGFLDLVGHKASQISVRFGASAGTFSGELDLLVPEPVSAIGFGTFDRDPLMDVMVPISAGLFNLRGDPRRDLVPVSYDAAVPLPAQGRIRGLAVEAFVDRDVEILALGEDGMRFFEAATGAAAPYPDGASVDALGDDVASADINGDGLSEFVLAFEGATAVSVCQGQGAPDALTVSCRPGPTLNDPVRRDGTRFANVDGDVDGELELLVSVSTAAEGAQVEVAFHDGNAVFEGSQRVPFFAAAGDDPDTPGVRESPWPLAIGDFDDDGRDDYVFTDKIVQVTDPVAGVPTEYEVVAEASSGNWNAAAVADMNGDGRLDVVVVLETLDGIDVFLNVPAPGGVPGAPVAFNKFHVDTDGSPVGVRTGDFDGDRIADVAFYETGFAGEPFRVSVVFGNTSGGPSAPVSMARFERVEVFEPVVTEQGINGFDGIDDLLVMSSVRDPVSFEITRSATILRGDSSRRMLSPFFFFDAEGAASGDVDAPVGFVVGDLLTGESSPGRDVLALAKADDEVVRARLLDGVDADGGLLQRGISAPIEAGDFDYQCALWVAGDLDGVVGDEIVGIDGVAGDGCDAIEPACVLRRDDVGALFDAGEPDLGSACADVGRDLRDTRRALLRDLDSDGRLDLLLLFAGGEDGPAVAVMWNDGSGLSAPTLITFPEGVELFDVDAIRVGTATPALAVLATGQIYLVALEQGTRSYGAPTPLLSQEGNGRLRIADIDGDGLDDLAFNVGGNLHVLTQEPQPPRGDDPGLATTGAP